MDQTKTQSRLIWAVRWIARVGSIGTILLVIGFAIGEGINFEQFTFAYFVGFLFFPVGICIGLILAWWKEGLGADVTIGSLLFFYTIHLITAGTFPKGWAFIVFASPGFIFALSWYLSRKSILPSA